MAASSSARCRSLNSVTVASGMKGKARSSASTSACGVAARMYRPLTLPSLAK